MPRRHVSGFSVRNDRWVISYADFITLLFAFFVVMYAVSSVNEEKYKTLSEALSNVFSSSSDVPPEQGKGENEAGMGIFTGGTTNIDAPKVTIAAPNQEETEVLRVLQTDMEVNFSSQIDAGEMQVTGNDLWIAIELHAGYLFSSGGALPDIKADPILHKIADLLKGHQNPIHVEGFTDNQKIATKEFPSNWELSAARAAAVVRLLAQFGVEPERMSAVGYGEFQPAYSNRTEQGRKLNRRIVIVVSRDRKVRRTVSSFGSQQVDSDAVSAVLAKPDKEEVPTIEQVETPNGNILFRQAEPITEP